MTTATAPLTETEIRKVLHPWRFDDAWSEYAGRLELIWDVTDMRPSELADFDALIGAAVAPIRDRAMAELHDALLAAALAFAAQHPDAPRTPEPDFMTFPKGEAAGAAAMAMRADWPDARPGSIDDGHGGLLWVVALDRCDQPGEPRLLRPDGSVR